MDQTSELRPRLAAVLPFWDAAGPEVRAALVESAVGAHLDEGSFAFMEGDRCDGLLFVLEGVLRVYKCGETGREVTLYRVEPGQSCILSTCCILSDDPFPAIARAESAVDGALVPAAVFRSWVTRHAFWQRHVFAMVSQRLAAVIATVEEVAFGRLDHRLARLLVRMVGPDGRLERTHQQLAAELGSSREVVSRLLKDFERRGWLALERNAVVVLELAALEAVGAGAS